MSGFAIGNGLVLGRRLSLGRGLSRGNGLALDNSVWYPTDLGASLFAFWDAERSDLVTQSGGLVSSFKDVIAGYDTVQATAGAQPIYSAVSFNGRAGITFDGLNDQLTRVPAPAAIPSGANPGELWAVASQTALVDDTTVRVVTGTGGNSALSTRRLQRSVVASVNTAGMAVGTGAATVTVVNTNVELYGRHVLRGVIGATTSRVDCDGVPGEPQAVTPNSGTSRIRIGANNNGTATSFWQGAVNAILYTAPLTDQQAALLTDWCCVRAGV